VIKNRLFPDAQIIAVDVSKEALEGAGRKLPIKTKFVKKDI
jgi:ribosomal protein L16/L10AE